MILVIGILVDDGIVIAENIYLHFEGGKSPMKAAVDGTMEVAPAVLTSILTTVVAFSPLLFLAGTRMEMMYDVAVVVIASLLFSLFEAFLVLPAHVGNKRILNRDRLKKKKKGLRKHFESFLVWIRESVYHHMLVWMIKYRAIMVGISVALFLITIGLFAGGHIKNTFFPMVDFDSFEINMAFTPGSGEKQTLEYLKRFEAAIWEVNEEMTEEFELEENLIERVQMEVGSAFRRQESGAHAGNMDIYPIDLEGLPLSGSSIAMRVAQKIGPVPEARKFTVAGRNRWGAPVSIGLMSINLQELEQAKEYLIERLEEMPQLKDVTENVALGKQEVRLKLKPRAYFLGLDENEIAGQVRQGFYGAQAQRLQVGRDELRIWVRYPKSGRLTLGQMERMKIKTGSGEYPLTELADYHLERGPVAINRYQGSREIRVEAETLDPFAPVPEILEQIEIEIMPDLLAQFNGIRYMFQGQQKYSNEALAKAKNYFLFAILLIIMILIFHFRSGQKTAIILIMIPIAMLGVIWGHGVHGKPLSMMSLWGMVALSGVIINDAIVFMAKYDRLLREGKKVREAIMEAGKLRLRPIILTSVTTSVGLFPIIFEKSIQAQFLIPMAISLAYGVAIGTLFILIFFPVLIMLVSDFRVFTRLILTGVKPTREEVETAVILHKRKLAYESNNSKNDET